MTSAKGTNERLYERYHTLARRPTIEDPRTRRIVFKSLGRVMRGWLPPDRDVRILDIACGEGAFLAFLRDRGYTNLMGFDISPENVAMCHQIGLTFVKQFDALKLGEWRDPDRFDAVYALDIIEHLPKQSAAGFLDEIRNRLKPGGFVVLQTPNMGSIMGCYKRYWDLSHEFGLTEKSAVDLMLVAGFAREAVEVRASWSATSFLGYLREIYLRLVHRLVFLVEDSGRPKIPTKNLLIRGVVPR